ncbi:MAG: cytochrome P450 [Acidimicrobiia bacterium]|nr:cytochrome P450 [Acidimicrobiia bacterium]
MSRLPGPPLWRQGLSGQRMRRDPLGEITALHERYGPVFATGAGPLKFVWLIGPDAHRELFVDVQRFSWREVTKPVMVVDGETAVVVSDGEDHARRRRIVQPAFNVRRIERHIPLMIDEVRRTVGEWQVGADLNAYQELRACIRRIVVRALFGDRFSSWADELGDRLQPALDFVDRPPPQLKINLPGTPWRRATTARRRTDELVFAEIEARRREGVDEDGDDVLSWLLAASDPECEGAQLNDQEVRDQVVSLIAAGYETTSAAVGWTVWAALANAGVWERLRAEVGDLPINAERLRSMTYLDSVVSESLRLWPPGALAGRKLREPIDAAGVRIPAGVAALYSPYVTQRMPELWPDPLAFRPERWDKHAPGYVEPVPLSYVPFGAGPRRCLGFAFALTEIKVLLAEVVRTADLQLVDTAEPARESVASLRPKGGVAVRVSGLLPLASSPATNASPRTPAGG